MVSCFATAELSVEAWAKKLRTGARLPALCRGGKEDALQLGVGEDRRVGHEAPVEHAHELAGEEQVKVRAQCARANGGARRARSTFEDVWGN